MGSGIVDGSATDDLEERSTWTDLPRRPCLLAEVIYRWPLVGERLRPPPFFRPPRGSHARRQPHGAATDWFPPFQHLYTCTAGTPSESTHPRLARAPAEAGGARAGQDSLVRALRRERRDNATVFLLHARAYEARMARSRPAPRHGRTSRRHQLRIHRRPQELVRAPGPGVDRPRARPRASPLLRRTSVDGVRKTLPGAGASGRETSSAGGRR